MLDGMYGRWKFFVGCLDIILGIDSIGSFVIVYYCIYDGKICFVCYLFYFNLFIKGYICVEGCILFYYDSLKCVLYFFFGGDYI